MGFVRLGNLPIRLFGQSRRPAKTQQSTKKGIADRNSTSPKANEHAADEEYSSERWQDSTLTHFSYVSTSSYKGSDRNSRREGSVS